METLERIEEAIRASDGDAIRARWEFGRQVIAQRQGKYLPRGVPEKICRRAGISNQELSNRTRVAEAYESPSELGDSGVTWTAIVNALPKTRKSPKPSPKLRPTPTAATFKEADRVEELIAKPDVVAALMAREADTKATKKAQAAIERREREAAKRQKEEDQQRQQVTYALRQQLVQGDRNWENLTEQLEMFNDTVSRYLEYIDGLVVPDGLRLKILERHLSKLQANLLQLRTRLLPDYQQPFAEIGQTNIITVS
jgi:hypothetical protein